MPRCLPHTQQSTHSLTHRLILHPQASHLHLRQHSPALRFLQHRSLPRPSRLLTPSLRQSRLIRHTTHNLNLTLSCSPTLFKQPTTHLFPPFPPVSTLFLFLLSLKTNSPSNKQCLLFHTNLHTNLSPLLPSLSCIQCPSSSLRLASLSTQPQLPLLLLLLLLLHSFLLFLLLLPLLPLLLLVLLLLHLLHLPFLLFLLLRICSRSALNPGHTHVCLNIC